MKSLLLAVVLVITATTAIAQDAPPKGFASIELLWPNGAPGAIGRAEKDIPKLYCYPAPGPGPHTAVVVLPGGGYTHVVMEKEGGVEARWLNEHGISAYVLQYRLNPAYMYPSPMQDGQRAVRFVRSHAKEWNLKPEAIGVWGFSAGGHLAGYLATANPHELLTMHPLDTMNVAVTRSEVLITDDIDKLSAHPDFAIFSYARLSLDPVIPGTFGMKTLIGAEPKQAQLDAVSPVLHVTKDTSPSFLYATSQDETVSSLNATSFYNALQLLHVPAELHIFERGPHGTHMGTDQPASPELAVFPILLENWLRTHGWLDNPAVQ